ncbi:CRISPR-associated endonuclease Cas3'' [Halalkalicoccus salilacus]|uniref:CRISPR-associated endonuclease Cas3'' n=1 Tax=Halalkalicoccus salilacus TaxID=3117459 RepID=UPI00300E9934
MNEPLEGIISHPGEGSDPAVPLDRHLQVVADRMVELNAFSKDGDPPPAAIARCIGRLHDFGKVTPMFQEHVRDEYVGERKYTFHSRIGAFAVAHALKQMGSDERNRLAGFLAVAHHHGALKNTAHYVGTDVIEPEREEGAPNRWATPQIESIDTECANAADTLLRRASNGIATWESFRESVVSGALFCDLEDLVTVSVALDIRDIEPAVLPSRLYDRFLRYWGALTIADKTHASTPEMEDSTSLLPKSLSITDLDNHIRDLQSRSQSTTRVARLNERRENARQEAMTDGVERLLNSDTDVGLLTLPTGLGKTFAGISTAFAVRDRIAETRNLDFEPTVVYALPYTSIIEQTREVFESTVWGADPASREFTVHHYLSDTVTEIDTEFGPEGTADTDEHAPPPSMLGESWRSGVVLTTFVQLFESLAGPTNAQGLKLPALANSVIVLDEPQTLSKPWWPAIRRLTETLTEEFSATIISMTATQPTLFTEASQLESVSLVTDVDEHFRATERITYAVDDSVWNYPEAPPLSHDDAAQRIVDSVLNETDGPSACSAMAICNTILSSRKLTKRVVEKGRATTGISVTHLGEIYEDVLQTQTPAPEDGSTATPDDRPPSDTIADETLRRLDFRTDDDDEWIWNGDPSERPLFVGTFNSRYRPYDRRALIQVADVLATAGVPFVFVSTQAVEAGVDISFARVYRDLASLDSIVQAAGRCNRSFEWGERGGEVTLWFLADPDDLEADPPATHIYETPDIGGHLDLVVRTIKTAVETTNVQPDTVPETTFTRDAIVNYFDEIDRQVTDRKELVTAIEECDGSTLGRASLIDETYETVDVVVAVTEFDRRLIEEMGDAFENGNEPRGFALLNDLVDMRVSIPIRDIEENLPMATRVDRKERGEPEGVRIFVHRGQAGDGEYALAEGGFIAEVDDPIARRFTT